MSKNLQKIMASKYPISTPTPIMKNNSSIDTNEKQHLTSKKMLTLTILFTGVFFILALPYTFRVVGPLFQLDNNSNKLVALHALIFAVIVFLVLRIV